MPVPWTSLKEHIYISPSLFSIGKSDLIDIDCIDQLAEIGDTLV